MKYLIIIITLFFNYALSAQQTFDINEQAAIIDGTMTGAIILDMKASKDEAKKAWNDYIQDNHNTDIKGYGFFRKKDKLTTDPIALSFLSDEKLILNTTFDGNEEQTQMSLYALREDESPLMMEYDALIINNLEQLTEEFVADFLPQYYDERVEKAKEFYNDSLDGLSDIEENIMDRRDHIKKMEEEILDLEKKQVQAEKQVEKSKKYLSKKEKISQRVKNKTNELK